MLLLLTLHTNINYIVVSDMSNQIEFLNRDSLAHTNKKLISIVAPVYNEEGVINELLNRITETVSPLENDYDFEFIFIDDGSKDHTLEIAKLLLSSEPRLRLIELRRNYGQTAALQAALDQAKGDIIISMDADLQHFPEEIPQFLEKIEGGYDVVCGWRYDRQEGIIRRWPSRIANMLIRRISRLTIHDIGTTYRAYRAEIIRMFGYLVKIIALFPCLLNGRGKNH